MLRYKLINNAEAKQYEVHVENLVARIEYIRAKNRIFLTHTEVPKALEGKGIGTAMVSQVLQDIKHQQLTLVPLCPFVSAYIKRHPEWMELVMKGVNIK